MLSTTGEVKITDFGLARINNDSARQALTQIGITMGTPLYMSPEQVEGSSLDSRSDIYSLGVTAYHTLAGQPPFEGENALAIAVQQVQDRAKPLAEIRPDVSSELCQLVHRMMAKDPSDRPATASALLKELRQIKIDVDEDWETVIGKLAATDTVSTYDGLTLSQSKLAATQQLQSIMKGNTQPWWMRPKTLLRLAAISILSLILGVLVGNRTIPKFPLDVDASSAVKIPKQPTIEKQYEAAYWGTYALGASDDPKRVEFWQAVLDYFPLEQASSDNLNQTRLYYLRAKARLGEVFLSQKKLDQALVIYESLEGSAETFEHFRVMGTAGKAIAYDRLPPEWFQNGAVEKQQKIRDCVTKVGSRSELLNQYMREAFEDIRKRYSASQSLFADRWA
jgi:serine/threonine-protein kinase